MKSNYYLDVVDVEKIIFSGFVYKIQISGVEGELEIFQNHIPLITQIKPGILCIFVKKNEEKRVFYLSGGILEIKFNKVKVLADTTLRAESINKKMVIKAKKEAEKNFSKLSIKNNTNYLKASISLSKEIAKLRVMKLIKK